VVLSVLIALPAAAGPARAQDSPAPRSERPYRGLFRSGADDAAHVLTATASVGGGYDEVLLRGVDSTGDPLRRLSGGYSMVSGGLSYGLTVRRFAFVANGTTAGRLYANSSDRWLQSRNANALLGVQLFPATRVTVGESYYYSPYNLLALSMGAFGSTGFGTLSPALIDDDVAFSRLRYSAFATTGTIVQSFRQKARTTMQLDYAYARREITSTGLSASGSFYEDHRAGGTIQRQWTRNLSLRLAYHYRRTDYPSASERQRFEGHDLNAGVDFNRPLSLTRRTQVSFSTGSVAYATQTRTQYRLSGDARLTHEIGRTWSASLVFGRNIGFVDTFDRPILYEAVTAGVSGLITRRVQFNANVRSVDGDVGLTGVDNGYHMYMGTASLTTSVSRSIGMSATYYYLQYRFQTGAALPTNIDREGERQGIRGTISVWVPLINRARKP